MIALTFELHANQFFAPFFHLSYSILNSSPKRDWCDGTVGSLPTLRSDVNYVRHLPDVVGDESNELGLLNWAEFVIGDFFESVFQTLTVLNQDIIP